MRVLKAGCASCFFGMLIIFALIGIGIFTGITSQKKGGLKPTSTFILSIDLSKGVADMPFSSKNIFGILPENGSLNDIEISDIIIAAASDPLVKSIYIYGSSSMPNIPFAKASTIRQALLYFKDIGKKDIYAYLENTDKSNYYIFSAANNLWINPLGSIDFSGIAFQGIFFGNALKKYGVVPEIIKCGQYKDFGDMFTKDKFSFETKGVLEFIAKDNWDFILSAEARQRNIDLQSMKNFADKNPIIDAENALKFKLVDKTTHKDQAETILKNGALELETLSIEEYSQFVKYAGNFETRIAVVNMSGDIISNKFNGNYISAEKYCPIFEEIAKDDNIKAVIIRINSGGGSAYASEEIRRAVELLKIKKPVYVSISSLCASGAYWISTAATKIFAQPESIVGSIGVFSINFDIEKLANDYGVTFDSAKSGEFADAFSITRKMTEKEKAIMQEQANIVYNRFKDLVSDSRNINKEKMNYIATGVVWNSESALNLKLIDAADMYFRNIVDYVAKEQKIDLPLMDIYPKAPTIEEAIGDFFNSINLNLTQSFFSKEPTQKIDASIEYIKHYKDKRGVYLMLPYRIKEAN